MLRERIILNQIVTSDLIDLKKLKMQQHASAAATSHETYEHHFSHAGSEFLSISKLLFPWLESKTEEGDKLDKYTTMWEKAFGIKVGSEEWDSLVNKYDKIEDLYATKYRNNNSA